MTQKTVKPSKKELTALVDNLFNSNWDDIDSEFIKTIPPKDFVKEVLVQKKKHGWRSNIKIPCNWQADKTPSLLEKIEEARKVITGEEFDTFWEAFTASMDISVWGSDTWAPHMLPNGAILIRNHHRVIAIDEQVTGNFLCEQKQLHQQIQQLQEFAQNNMENEDGIHFSFIHRDTNGFQWTTQTPNELSEYGQTILFISNNLMEQAKESEEFEDTHFIFESVLDEAASNSRSGHAVLRIFQNVTFVYGTFRAGDEYDTILENFSYYLGSSPDQEGYRDDRIESDLRFLTNKVSSDLQEQDDPDLFSEPVLKRNHLLFTLFKDKLYKNYASSKASQMMEFAPFFGSQHDTPSTYYNSENTFLELSKNFNNNMIVAKLNWNWLPYITNSKATIEDNITDSVATVDCASVKAYLPIPKNESSDKDEDIFDYGTPAFDKRLDEVISAINQEFEDYSKENPFEEDDRENAEKEFMESYGYDYPFDLIFITDSTPMPSDAHHHGLKISGVIGNSATVIIPSYGFYQGYSDGELDTGNASQFLTSSELESSGDEDDEEEVDWEDDEEN